METGRDIRPTLGRVREAVFNVIAHATPPGDFPAYLEGQSVADICCGSGALGLEAISRGAAHATFIDKNPGTLALARRNAATLGVEEQCRFIAADAAALPTVTRQHALALLDPPYGLGITAAILRELDKKAWLLPGAMVVVETGKRDTVPEAESFTLLRERRYGNARVLFFAYGVATA